MGMRLLDRIRTRRSAIACDCGAAAVRAVQLARRGGAVSLHDCLNLPIDGGPSSASVAEAAVADNVIRALNQGAFHGRDVSLVLSPPDVRFTSLKVSESVLSQPPDRLHAALAFEMAREVRAEPAELEVRHWRLPPGHQQDLNVMAVSVLAARAGGWFHSLRKQRVSLSRIDVAPCAALRLASRFWSPAPRDLWGILDLGRFHTTLTMVLGGTPTYIRSLAVSCDNWTRTLMDAFDVPAEEAERIKRHSGIEMDGSGDSSSESAEDPSESAAPVVFRLLRGSIDTLVRDIDLCFSYVAKSYSDGNISRLLLVGGGAEMRGLPDYLALHLSMPVDRLCTTGSSAAWERPLAIAPFGCDSAIALGAALADVEAA